MSPTAKYSLTYLIFITAISAGLFYWNVSHASSVPLKVHPWSFYILGFVAIVFFLNHLFLLNADNKKPAVFIRRFMATTAMRLFLFMIIMIGYAVNYRSLAGLFIWHILVFYMAFTVFEIVSLYRHFNRK